MRLLKWLLLKTVVRLYKEVTQQLTFQFETFVLTVHGSCPIQHIAFIC